MESKRTKQSKETKPKNNSSFTEDEEDVETVKLTGTFRIVNEEALMQRFAARFAAFDQFKKDVSEICDLMKKNEKKYKKRNKK